MIAADFPPSSSVHGLSFSAASRPTSLPTAELPDGFYLLSVEKAGEREVFKVVKRE